MGEPSPPSDEVYRKLSGLTTIVTGGLVFILVFTISMTTLMVWQAYRSGAQSQQLKQIAVETHDSLCALRADVKRRYLSSQDYLEKHPSGAPSLGLTANDIRRSLKSQRTTLEALQSLKCG